MIAGFVRKDLQLLILRPSDIPKLWPMQAYYLRLRRTPPPYGKYNPLQKAAYTSVLFVLRAADRTVAGSRSRPASTRSPTR